MNDSNAEEEILVLGRKDLIGDESVKTCRANSESSADFFCSSSRWAPEGDKIEIIEANSFQSTQQIEKIKAILKNLYKSLELNRQSKHNLLKNYEMLSCKQNLIESTLDKIKKVNRSKQKKHVKYLRYIPLNKIYFYSPRKNHFYYILMDIVVKSRKKSGDKKQELADYNCDEEEETEKGERSNKSKDKKNKSGNNKSSAKRSINRNGFSEEEDDILKKLILYTAGDYVDWQQISKDLNDFLVRVIQVNKRRTPLECYTRSLELSDFYTYKKWTNNEDQILKKAILYYGPKNWQQISYCLEGRNNSQAFHRWMKGINPKIKRSKWSFEEDLTLGIALKIYGNKKWSKIANHLGGRTDIQCRERFCNILDPSLEEVEWKPHEDAKLLLLYDKMKNKWSKIAKEFGNRTDNTCWRRWKYLESIRKTMRSSSLRNYSNVQQHNYSVTLTNNNPTIVESLTEPLCEEGEIISNRKKKKEIFEVRKIRRLEGEVSGSDL